MKWLPQGELSRRSDTPQPERFPVAGAKLFRTSPGVTCNSLCSLMGREKKRTLGNKRWLVRGTLGLSEERVASRYRGEGLSLRIEEGVALWDPNRHLNQSYAGGRGKK